MNVWRLLISIKWSHYLIANEDRDFHFPGYFRILHKASYISGDIHSLLKGLVYNFPTTA